MTLHVVALGLLQGVAELLPISSSAHVILLQKFLGYDPSSAEMLFVLVMLHAGTMGAVIHRYVLGSRSLHAVRPAILATLLTLCGAALIKYGLAFFWHTEIELLFRQTTFISYGLLAVGLMMLCLPRHEGSKEVTMPSACAIGAIQVVSAALRGFSRSGATISMALFLGIKRQYAEDFSFLLALLLTPFVLVHEIHRLWALGALSWPLVEMGMLGALVAYGSGFVALRFLSQLIATDRFRYFGIYCLLFAIVNVIAS